MAETMDGRSGETKKKKKRKRDVAVSVEGISESDDHIAPVVGYFPSGYDPTRSSGRDPSIRVFRHKKRSSRLELVVSPPDSSVDFVGRSYAGEAAGVQLCNYALGVFDKESQTLKIVPIAANKILRLEPKLAQKRSADKELSEGLTEEGHIGDKSERRITDLTTLYGTKRDKDRDNKWKTLNEQRNEANDPSAQEHVESHNVDEDEDDKVIEDTAETVARNIPPHDPSADTPDKAYRLDDIIPNAERVYLMDILENFDPETDISSMQYPSFVYNRIHKLKAIQNEELRERLACILSYITHLQSFWERMSASQHSKFMSQDKDYHRIPRLIYQKLLRTFVDSETNKLSSEKNELLIGYILVLTLFADEFRTDPSDIARDLKMTVNSLKPYFQQLGCKVFRESPLQPMFMTLPVPLHFSDLKKIRRRRQ